MAVATAARVLTLPEAGTIRYPASDPRSNLSALTGSLRAAGFHETGSVKAAAAYLFQGGDPSFRASTYWDPGTVRALRAKYLGSGWIVVFALVGAALATSLAARKPPTGP